MIGSIECGQAIKGLLQGLREQLVLRVSPGPLQQGLLGQPVLQLERPWWVKPRRRVRRVQRLPPCRLKDTRS